MAEHFKGELPSVFRILSAPARVLPLGLILTRAVQDLAHRRPALFERLGEHRSGVFFIGPSDLDFAFLIVPDGPAAQVKILSKQASASAVVVVRGPLLSLLGLLDGTFDGDALFFNRAISISGKTEAILFGKVEPAIRKQAFILIHF